MGSIGFTGRSAVKWGGMRKGCRTKVVSLGGLGVTIVHAQPVALNLRQTQAAFRNATGFSQRNDRRQYAEI
jgi:hypothetical protein